MKTSKLKNFPSCNGKKLHIRAGFNYIWTAILCQQYLYLQLFIKPEPVFINVYGVQESIPRNEFRQPCSLAGRYDNPIPTRFLAPIDCLKIPAPNTGSNGANSFSFLSSLSLLPPSHHGRVWLLPVDSLLLTNTISLVRACLLIWLERWEPKRRRAWASQYLISRWREVSWARICKPFKELSNRFPARRAGSTTLFVMLTRQVT